MEYSMLTENTPFYILDDNFDVIGIIDTYESLIWTDRYDKEGDFELCFGVNAVSRDIIDKIQLEAYCKIDSSEHFMIIKKIEMVRDEDDVMKITLSGISLESILSRRILLGKVEFVYVDENKQEHDVNLQDSIQQMLTDTIIEPADLDRKIHDFVFIPSEDERITSLMFRATYENENLGDAVQKLCAEYNLGYKIIVNKEKQIIFSLYIGEDRSNNVIFSPFYDNIYDTNFYSSTEGYANYIFIEKSSHERDKKTEYDLTSAYTTLMMPTGIRRIEVYEKKNKLFDNDDSQTVSDEELQKKAVKFLRKENGIVSAFEGEVIPFVVFTYGTDYFTGDHVQLVDYFGNSKTVYISEVVISYDDEGLKILPTFEEIEETE